MRIFERIGRHSFRIRYVNEPNPVRMQRALEQIRDREWVENCLDPQWAAQVAAKALVPDKLEKL